MEIPQYSRLTLQDGPTAPWSFEKNAQKIMMMTMMGLNEATDNDNEYDLHKQLGGMRYTVGLQKNATILNTLHLGRESVSIIQYTRPGSSIKQPTWNWEATLRHVNWPSSSKISLLLYNGSLDHCVFCEPTVI